MVYTFMSIYAYVAISALKKLYNLKIYFKYQSISIHIYEGCLPLIRGVAMESGQWNLMTQPSVKFSRYTNTSPTLY